MTRRRFVSSSLRLSVFAGVAIAQAWCGFRISAVPNYFLHGWQAEDGLPENKVMAVVQTRDGYLWLGTYSGLARFDGVRFTTFDNSNTPEMHDSSVTSLFENQAGDLWIGHATGGVTRYRNGRFQALKPPRWSGGKVQGIREDEAGDLWLLNPAGLLARLRDGLTLSPETGGATNLLEIASSDRGIIWIARAGRLSQLKQGRLTTLDLGGEPGGSYVQGICASRDGGLWVASNEHLFKWTAHQRVEDFGIAPWGGTPIHSFIETRTGYLAAGTSDHGLYLVHPKELSEGLQFCRTKNFPTDWVLSLCEDRESNLWVGTGGAGLFAVRATSVQTVAPPDEWQGRAVLSVSVGREGTLWVGTEGAGIYRLQAGRWDHFAKDAGIRNPYVWSVAEDRQGVLWAGTWGGSLYTRRGDRFERAPGVEELTTPMPALLCARQGGLWIGTEMGLLHYQDGRARWVAPGPELHDVRAMVEESGGTVWFGMYGGGLGSLKNGQVQRFQKQDGLSSDFIECLHLDEEGALWIGTFGGGLNRFKQGRFAVINRSQGLANNVICHIEDDGQGYFWMSSHGGIMRVSKAELNECADGQVTALHCLSYGMSDGLPTLQCSSGLQPAGCRTPDGRLWFPTSKGLVSVDPGTVKTNLLAPPVVIEELLVDDRLVARGPGPSPLEIPAGRHRFEFQYTGLSFVAPEKVRFRYQVEGLDQQWVEAGTKRSVNYSHIPPGRYTFHVTACNNHGVWNETGAAWAFIVLPFFWQTVWFRVLVGGAMIAASGGLVWFDTRRRMRRKLERSERQRAIEHERARIAHDIHDDLGAHLTRITMLSESARGELEDPARAEADLKQIYDTSRELTRSMDEIVWAVNPKHDTLESLANYLEKFAQDFLETAGIRCRLDVPVQVPAWPLRAEVRHNLFLAFKEALHNVVKHAAASEVCISLLIGPAAVELVVEDNGQGFAAEADGPARFGAGNGLTNMRHRLTSVGGRCEITSRPGQGTKVVCAVPARAPVGQRP